MTFDCCPHLNDYKILHFIFLFHPRSYYIFQNVEWARQRIINRIYWTGKSKLLTRNCDWFSSAANKIKLLFSPVQGWGWCGHAPGVILPWQLLKYTHVKFKADFVITYIQHCKQTSFVRNTSSNIPINIYEKTNLGIKVNYAIGMGRSAIIFQFYFCHNFTKWKFFVLLKYEWKLK